jgi:hypothetical protein
MYLPTILWPLEKQVLLHAKRAEDSKKQKYREFAVLTPLFHRGGNLGSVWDEAKAFFSCFQSLSRSITHDPLSYQNFVQRIGVSIQQLGSSTIQT